MSHCEEKAELWGPHPAAIWAENTPLDALQIDCLTALILKILDKKCQLNLEEQFAIMVIYHTVRPRNGLLFDESVHQIIEQAKHLNSPQINGQIHELRLDAENRLPTPVVDYFELYLRESLFGV
jgi:hypothetical protein